MGVVGEQEEGGDDMAPKQTVTQRLQGKLLLRADKLSMADSWELRPKFLRETLF